MKEQAFIRTHEQEWQQLDTLMAALSSSRPISAEQLASLPAATRRVSHQLNLARQRGYSQALAERLNHLTLQSRLALYRHGRGRQRWLRTLGQEFPQAVRRQWRWHLAAALVFIAPMLYAMALVYSQPEMAYMLLGPQADFIVSMYTTPVDRSASDDVLMFSYYIYNNISLAFRSFVSGLLAGIGSLLVLATNGLFMGGVWAHLDNADVLDNLSAFVVTHSAPELIGLILAGGGGFRLGSALVFTGRRSRREALRQAARDTGPVIWGVFVLLFVAAVIEGFWSALPVDPTWKYLTGALSWGLLALFLLRGGRARVEP